VAKVIASFCARSGASGIARRACARAVS